MLPENFTFNVLRETLNRPEFEGFVGTLKEAIEELARKAPWDGSITVDLNPLVGGYKIAIRIASSALNFLEVGEGRSPFFALENALLKAQDTLRVWAINRRF